MTSLYTVKLEKFEGPLDLLLELIEKEKLDISEISLSRVADQFLEHMNLFQEKEPGQLADFLVIAAKLILIKSRALLPFLELSAEEEGEIHDLKERLFAYQKIKEGAHAIAQLEHKRHIAYHRASGLRDIAVFLPPDSVTVQTLYEQMARLTKENEPAPELEEKKISVIISFEEKLTEIRTRLQSGAREYFHTLTDPASKQHMIITFLAVLELVRQNVAGVEQTDLFGEIIIAKI